jgi:hypothetical protein
MGASRHYARACSRSLRNSRTCPSARTLQRAAQVIQRVTRVSYHPARGGVCPARRAGLELTTSRPPHHRTRRCANSALGQTALTGVCHATRLAYFRPLPAVGKRCPTLKTMRPSGSTSVRTQTACRLRTWCDFLDPRLCTRLVHVGGISLRIARFLPDRLWSKPRSHQSGFRPPRMRQYSIDRLAGWLGEGATTLVHRQQCGSNWTIWGGVR